MVKSVSKYGKPFVYLKRNCFEWMQHNTRGKKYYIFKFNYDGRTNVRCQKTESFTEI